jgi:hypothetical protein
MGLAQNLFCSCAGLRIESEIPLPGYVPLVPSHEAHPPGSDVRIFSAPALQPFKNVTIEEPNWQANATEFLLGIHAVC